MNKNVPQDDSLRLHDIWVLRSISSNGLPAEMDYNDAKMPVLEIHVAEKKIFGNDGCNDMFGNIETLDATSISFGKIGSTKMYCPNMVLPTAYTKALLLVRTYKLKGLELFFFDLRDKEILRFQKVD